jgi:hypothetical protein
MLETGSSDLTKALQSIECNLPPEGVLFREFRSFIQLNFSNVVVVFAPRSCNKLIHELAAFGSRQTVVRVLWVDVVPGVMRPLCMFCQSNGIILFLLKKGTILLFLS